ncbi:MAG: hypothetical protein ACOX5G_05290 [Kiritimatiellia bacterium]|jgi:predicted RNA-binding Zn-ribbon protein involved in translation (DUF1610 family)
MSNEAVDATIPAADKNIPTVDDEGRAILETDIVFECPECGHSLVIDYRGAGLVINCIECGEPVQVPIPEGMQLDDLDQAPEDQSAQLAILRRLLAESDARAAGLVTEMASLKQDSAAVTRVCEALESRLVEVRAALERIQEGQSALANVVHDALALLGNTGGTSGNTGGTSGNAPA